MCQALVKRSPASYEDGGGSSSGPAAFGVEPLLPSSLRRRPSSPSQGTQSVSISGGCVPCRSYSIHLVITFEVLLEVLLSKKGSVMCSNWK